MIMIKEHKELLLNDLCQRLPYGVKVQYEGWNEETEEYIDVIDVLYSINIDNWIKVLNSDEEVYIENIKPYLFPLSSMTDEQVEEYNNLNCWELGCFPHTEEALDYLIKNHFDYRYLIDTGLAIDATNKEIYEK